MSSDSVVVIGNGWAALGAVGLLVTQGVEVRWITGSGSRLLAPLSFLEWGPGVEAWGQLASRFGIDCPEAQPGFFLREFRNKAFREPMWLKPPTPEAKLEARNQTLWLPEQSLAPLSQARFSITPVEMEVSIRKELLEHRFSNLKVVESVPVTGFQFGEGEQSPSIVSLASGERIECSRIIYADRWSLLYQLQGLPKPLLLLRKREPMGVLQASFVHNQPIAVGVTESFFAPIARDAGDQIERHVWGCFTSDGMRSIWTVCLTAEEVEDNHAIAKKLRKLKNTLDKVFESSGMLPEEKGKFGSTLLEEQVRFEEESLFSEGEPLTEPIQLKGIDQIQFLTDGYGPSWAMAQAWAAIVSK